MLYLSFEFKLFTIFAAENVLKFKQNYRAEKDFNGFKMSDY